MNYCKIISDRVEQLQDDLEYVGLSTDFALRKAASSKGFKQFYLDEYARLVHLEQVIFRELERLALF